MDILIIAAFCGGLDGKGNNRFLYLADLLCKDHEVEILTSDFIHGSKSYLTDVPDIFPFKITLAHEGHYKKNVSLRRLYAHNIWAKSVQSYLNTREKPDVIYLAIPPVLAADSVAKYCERNNVRFIIDIQDLWPEAFKIVFKAPVISDIIFAPFNFLANNVYKRADAIVAVSDTYVNRALRVSDKCQKGTTVFLGTELRQFDKNVIESTALRLPGQEMEYANVTMNDRGGAFFNKTCTEKNNEIWLAYCGNLGVSYDLNIVFDALRILNDKKLKFIIMGAGERRTEFEKNARGLNCVFTGRLPYSQMCGLLADCDIAVNPISQGAQQSIINKHADYAAAGLPVLNTQECEEYRNLVADYNMGFNCDNRNAADLAEKLRLLINDEKLRAVMGKNARRCAEERFDRAKTYRLISEVITRV